MLISSNLFLAGGGASFGMGGGAGGGGGNIYINSLKAFIMALGAMVIQW